MQVLIARAGALGDLLLLRRTLANLQRAGHAVTLLAPPAGRLLLGSGVAAHLDWEAGDAATLLGRGPLAQGEFTRALRRCDLALAYTRSVDLVHGLARLVPLTIAFDPAPHAGAGHAAAWFTRPLAAFGLDVSSAPPDLAPTPAELDAAEAWLARLPAGFLALHPGSGSPAKNWPFERFLDVAEALAPREPWLLALGPAEEHLARTRGAGSSLARAVIARGLALDVLAALLSRAGRYVGNDSGATHLAAACGAPTLALFGPTDPAVWAPDAARVGTLRAPAGDLAALGVEAVVAAARAFFRA